MSTASGIRLSDAVYSVWSDWARLAVKAYVGVDEIEIVGSDGRVVAHPRRPFGGRSIDYRHYLPANSWELSGDHR